MPSYCLKCGENTKSFILQVSRAINNGIIILSKCTVCGDKISKFIKKQEEKGLLSNLPSKKNAGILKRYSRGIPLTFQS